MTCPGSLRLGFFGHRFSISAAASRQAAPTAQTITQPAVWRIPKTFSAGPCSFSSQEFWFAKPRLHVQPLCDSRHGRIAFKAFSLSLISITESRRLQSVPRAQCQPLSLAGGGSPKFIRRSCSSFLETSVLHRKPLPWPSDTKRPWPACRPRPWSR
jgi:hypothetical protein